MNHEASEMGISVPSDATALEIPPEVLLKGYRIAQWTSFAFGAIGLTLTVVFLHGIGVVGSKKEKAVVAPEEAQPEERRESKDERVMSEKEADVSLT